MSIPREEELDYDETMDDLDLYPSGTLEEEEEGEEVAFTHGKQGELMNVSSTNECTLLFLVTFYRHNKMVP